MLTIKMLSQGEQVRVWQLFLIDQGLLEGKADGIFGPKTDAATKNFQQKYGLAADGIVGQKTTAKAVELGFKDKEPKILDNNLKNEYSNNDRLWVPPLPNFKPLISNAERQQIFGKFSYKMIDPVDLKIDGIIITDNWEKENIITIQIPQLINMPLDTENGKPLKSGNVRCHKLIEKQLRCLFEAWEKQNLLGLIKTWSGAFYARMIRKNKKNLSNHAFGSAFDINQEWNTRGAVPALINQKGSVRKLVKLANEYGFYWGGHYPPPTPLDGMHFEIAKLI